MPAAPGLPKQSGFEIAIFDLYNFLMDRLVLMS